MKKLFIIVAILLLGAGGYYFYSTQTQKSSTGMQQSGGLFGSIKDALSKSLSLQCTFVNDNVPTTAYMKAGAVRVDTNGQTPDQKGSFIMKDQKLYFWQAGSKQGTLMNIAAPSVTPGTATQGSTTGSTSDQNQGDNLLTTLDKFKDKCKPAVVADSLFTPPSDVKFVDFSKMIPTVPTGAQGSQPSEQDIQKMMQQYQQNNSSGQ